MPGGQAVGARLLSQSLVELDVPARRRTTTAACPLARLGRAQAPAPTCAQEVHDPVLRDKLTPRYALGCKRPSFHNEYLATFNRDNVDLETTPIERIDPTRWS